MCVCGGGGGVKGMLASPLKLLGRGGGWPPLPTPMSFTKADDAVASL